MRRTIFEGLLASAEPRKLYESEIPSYERLLQRQTTLLNTTSTTTTTTTTSLTNCSMLDSCSSCAEAWPSCAWCGSSGSCAPAPLELRTYALEHHSVEDHVVFDVEEHQKTFGGTHGVRTGPSCRLWLYKAESCAAVRDSCGSGSQGCTACTAVSGCGYCYEGPDRPGQCLPGTFSGRIRLSPWHSPCQRPPQRTKQWMFADWKGKNDGGAWDSGCVQHCPQDEVHIEDDGRISLGTWSQLIGYPLGARCSWEIRPSAWPKGWEMRVVLAFHNLSQPADTVVVIELPLEHDQPSREVCRSEHGQDNWGIARGPVLISFNSERPAQATPGHYHRARSIGAWSASWLVGPSWMMTWSMPAPGPASSGHPARWFTSTSTTTALLHPPIVAEQLDDLGVAKSQSMWIGALVVSFLLASLLFLTLWRLGFCQPLRHSSDPVDPGPSTMLGNFDALERAVPSCKPQAIGQHQGKEAEGNEKRAASTLRPKTCSVCLSDFETGEMSRRLPCQHIFHVQCIDSWLARSWACPLCRQELPCRIESPPVSTALEVPSGPQPSSIGAPTNTQDDSGVVGAEHSDAIEQMTV